MNDAAEEKPHLYEYHTVRCANMHDGSLSGCLLMRGACLTNIIAFPPVQQKICVQYRMADGRRPLAARQPHRPGFETAKWKMTFEFFQESNPLLWAGNVSTTSLCAVVGKK